MQEAWEEAGVKNGNISPDPFGTYEYQKQLDSGGEATCRTKVFALEVNELVDEYPESNQRDRKWVSPKEAADLVQEPQLQDMLRSF